MVPGEVGPMHARASQPCLVLRNVLEAEEESSLSACWSVCVFLSQRWRRVCEKLLDQGEVIQENDEPSSHPLLPAAWLWYWQRQRQFHIHVVSQRCHWILIRSKEDNPNFTFVLSQLHSCRWLGDSWLHLFSKEVNLDQPLCSSRLSSSPLLVSSWARRTQALFGGHSGPTFPRTNCAMLDN